MTDIPDALLEMGAYGFAEAAKLARINASTVRSWFLANRAGRSGPAPLRPDLPSVGTEHAIGFLDLIDLIVVARLKDAGHSLRHLKTVYVRLQKRLRSRHPFAHRRLLADEHVVLLGGGLALARVSRRIPRVSERLPSSRRMRVTESVVTGQQVGQADLVERWNVAPGIVIDPRRAFGKPVVRDEGISTFVLHRSFLANSQDADFVADLFGITRESVGQAVQFEESLRTAA